jgi:CBS domain-containing protein
VPVESDDIVLDDERFRYSAAFYQLVHLVRSGQVILAAAGLEKVEAISALLRAGLVTGLITNGDIARALATGARSLGARAVADDQVLTRDNTLL